ncbi:MAG: hypothetical protein IJP03_06380 [Christensenellaceae bacterium]|nr:hypothetical protein [Christensenellaceae bacterium]
MIKVIGIGDNVVDKYVHQSTYYPGGCSINFATYAARLGHEAAFIGLLARDKEAAVIRASLDLHGIDYSRCNYCDGETGICSTQFIDGDRIIIDDNDLGAVKATPMKLSPEQVEYIATFDVAHSSRFGYMEGEFKKVKAAGVPLVYDFADDWTLEKIDAICPDITVALISGGDRTDEELKEILKRAYSHGLELAITTIGMRGAIIYDGKEFYTKKPFNITEKAMDTMGAGDSFLTGFITTYYDGKKTFANMTASAPERFASGTGKDDYKADLIRYAMSVGNLVAITTCFVNGATGNGVKYE